MCENCNRKFKVPVEIDFRSIIDQLDTVKPANTVADSKTNKDDCVSSADASGSNGESFETNGVSSKATVNDIIRSVLPMSFQMSRRKLPEFWQHAKRKNWAGLLIIAQSVTSMLVISIVHVETDAVLYVSILSKRNG